MAKDWTQEEEVKLSKLWLNNKSTDIACIMGRSNASIRTKAKKMGLERSDEFKKKLNQSWSEEQVRILRQNPKMPYKLLSELIGKPVNSIRTKAHGLGLTKKRGLNSDHMKTNKVSVFIEPESNFKGTVSLSDIKDNQCHYTTDTGASMMLCGADVHDGRSYCTEHCHVVYTDFGKARSVNVKPLGGFK